MYPGASFGRVQNELAVFGYFLFYLVGLLAAAWHFAYGVWLFMAKWGIVIGESARKKTLVACIGLFLLISGVGLASLYSFKYRYPQMPADKDSARQIEQMQPEETAK
jgi:succinate dehydrogenase / fumarate reductase cytochrome b subunit